MVMVLPAAFHQAEVVLPAAFHQAEVAEEVEVAEEAEVVPPLLPEHKR